MHTSPLRISRKGKTLHYGSHGRFSCHRAVVSAEYRFAYNCLSIYLSSLLDLFLGSIPHMYTSLCLQVLQDTSGCYLKVGYKMYTWNLSGNVFIFNECPAQLQWCILLATSFLDAFQASRTFSFKDSSALRTKQSGSHGFCARHNVHVFANFVSDKKCAMKLGWVFMVFAWNCFMVFMGFTWKCASFWLFCFWQEHAMKLSTDEPFLWQARRCWCWWLCSWILTGWGCVWCTWLSPCTPSMYLQYPFIVIAFTPRRVGTLWDEEQMLPVLVTVSGNYLNTSEKRRLDQALHLCRRDMNACKWIKTECSEILLCYVEYSEYSSQRV